MGIGYGIWQVEGMKLGRVWAMDNIKVDRQGIGLRSLDFVQNVDISFFLIYLFVQKGSFFVQCRL